MPKFSVDTQLFRELGELLVGRDSTALVELVKNAYDADATRVVVHGEALDDPNGGVIRIMDDGIGMTPRQFEQGFLRVASRTKTQRDVRSVRYRRRYTGEKGIGRLAAHKLARVLHVLSTSWEPGDKVAPVAIEGAIDWDAVERFETLDEVDSAEAIAVSTHESPPDGQWGTSITLRRLRRAWTTLERSAFMLEVQSFKPHDILTSPVPTRVVDGPLLFEKPVVRDVTTDDPGFEVELSGEFVSSDEYWQAALDSSNWVIEIDVDGTRGTALYAIAPTRRTLGELAWAVSRRYEVPVPGDTPSFQSRILVREGQQTGPRALREWASRATGVRVFMEGFRVLPYGEPRNDWLALDFDVSQRARTLGLLQDPTVLEAIQEGEDQNVGLVHLPNKHYFGAVFLTHRRAPGLRLLVNREGFIPDASFQALTRLVRLGIDLGTRVRAADRQPLREERRQRRSTTRGRGKASALAAVNEAAAAAKASVSEALQYAERKDWPGIERALRRVNEEVISLEEHADELASESSMIRVLASLGTQLAAFVHEVNTLLHTAQAIEKAASKLRSLENLPRAGQVQLSTLVRSAGDLRRGLERQASFLTDVVTPDARRRRSKQSLAERFEAARRLVEPIALRRETVIENAIPAHIKSPSMFPSELIAVFANLLSNAVKAAGTKGRIRASAERLPDGSVRLMVQNTGVAVKVDEAERWFAPFESTTTKVDPVLGQGMGLGLPITRTLLNEYGATVRFVRPAENFATAVEIALPG